MANKDFIVVVYDISNDKRRTKLHNVLLDFGTPVQDSVFECLLDDRGQARMKKRIHKTIRPRKDQVRFYYLCAECLEKVEVTSGKEVLHESRKAIIIG